LRHFGEAEVGIYDDFFVTNLICAAAIKGDINFTLIWC
jgi:hypothetical protein